MKKTTNPYRRKRNKVIIIYLLTMVAAFLLGTVLFGLYDSTGAAFFQSLGFIFILIDSLGMILLVPFLICVVKLSKQAKLYDEQDGNLGSQHCLRSAFYLSDQYDQRIPRQER